MMRASYRTPNRTYCGLNLASFPCSWPVGHSARASVHFELLATVLLGVLIGIALPFICELGVRPCEAAVTPRQIGIVIGNWNYQIDTLDLGNSVQNDYLGMYAKLKKMNFSRVEGLANKRSGELLVELDRIAHDLRDDDLIVVFYSGHGAIEENRSVLLLTPDVKMEPTPAGPVAFNLAVPMMSLIDRLYKKGRTIVVFINSCLSPEIGLHRVSVHPDTALPSRGKVSLEGLFISYSTGFGEQALAVDPVRDLIPPETLRVWQRCPAPPEVIEFERNSISKYTPYGFSILHYIDHPGLHVKDLQAKILENVTCLTRPEQSLSPGQTPVPLDRLRPGQVVFLGGPARFYRRPWFWSIVGLTVGAAAAVGFGVSFGLRDNRPVVAPIFP